MRRVGYVELGVLAIAECRFSDAAWRQRLRAAGIMVASRFASVGECSALPWTASNRPFVQRHPKQFGDKPIVRINWCKEAGEHDHRDHQGPTAGPALRTPEGCGQLDPAHISMLSATTWPWHWTAPRNEPRLVGGQRYLWTTIR